MIAKLDGHGKGIKINIVNMVDIAKALTKLVACTTKYFGCKHGLHSEFDEKIGISSLGFMTLPSL